MKQLIFTACLFLLACDQKHENNDKKEPEVKSTKVEQYVSIDAKEGDITLTLDTTNTFDLTILIWDEATNKHSGSESLKGSWRLENSNLVLNASDSNTIIYIPSTSNLKIGKSAIGIPAYRFKSNSRPFFGTGYDLLEKNRTDKFILEQTKSAQK